MIPVFHDNFAAPIENLSAASTGYDMGNLGLWVQQVPDTDCTNIFRGDGDDDDDVDRARARCVMDGAKRSLAVAAPPSHSASPSLPSRPRILLHGGPQVELIRVEVVEEQRR